MLKPDEHYAQHFEDMFKCYYSEQGCFKIPVRMIVEKPISGEGTKESPAEVEAIMLCRDHSATYIAGPNVLLDKRIASDEAIEGFAKWGI